MKQTESQLVKSCLELMAWNKVGLFWRNNTGALKTERGSFMRFGEKGSPDIFMVWPPTGKFIGIECKVNKNKLSESQFEFGEKLIKAGGMYEIVRSIEDLQELLKQLNQPAR